MLELRQITKTYENRPLLRGISLRVAEGETVCLLGPSGSGKSTLLRIIAGLELPDSGQVLWDGKDLALVPPSRRGFGLMFQDYALFPHRNVIENVGFGLRMQNYPRQQIEELSRQALAQVNLLEFSQRKVTALSGGEQQRVALARALAPRPHLLMLDEPLGALDRNLREQLLKELRSILRTTRIPAIYVTHDQEEAFTIADRLILIHDGQIAQEGRPETFYTAPASAWVARFFGSGSLLDARVIASDPLKVSLAGCVCEVVCPHGEHAPGEKVIVLVRPGPVEICRQGEGHENALLGTVVDSIFTGNEYRVDIRLKTEAPVYFYAADQFEVGENVAIYLKPAALLCLGLETSS